MAYANKQDIIDLLGEETLFLAAVKADEQSVNDALTSAAIDDALAQASSEADTYISRRYGVPVPNPPRVLEIHVINMSIHHLSATSERLTDVVRQRYEDALSWLKDIAKGVANISGGEDEDGNTMAEAAPAVASFSSADPMFKRGG